MMKFSLYGFDLPCALDIGKVSLLEINDPMYYRRTIEGLLDIYHKRAESNMCVLSGADEVYDIAKSAIVVTDVFAYDLASRTIITALYRQIAQDGHLEAEKLAHLESQILEVMGDIDVRSTLSLHYQNEVALGDIIKMLHVTLSSSIATGFMDKLYGILDVADQLLHKSVVIFVNQRNLMTHSELVALSQYIENSSVSVLFIEKETAMRLSSESTLRIDSDLCVFSTD